MTLDELRNVDPDTPTKRYMSVGDEVSDCSAHLRLRKFTVVNGEKYPAQRIFNKQRVR